MGLIITCIVGGLIGALAGVITGKDFPAGILGNIIAGLIGSWVGTKLFGSWGIEWGGIFIFPALLGAIVFIICMTLLLRTVRSA
ncbi:GlsB/YeaQ/YmgE family stress response membrane protein [Bacillus cytotoxicus]|uniref:GlsB/YeaQ/YmgE family stress response membrane protein n=1 Tax=unclassified Bacillus cereus group TaxID=2750818 RepID=UPI001F5698EA|nr:MULTISPECIES: GlsB/YeaQ/YmgE family stress response membrane protein [unclassified Bacillus cereus group]EMA6342065.1 GlsB/YeaQ/YmgE family stress response membrane protein [Bacillus cytotoxicus]